MKKIKIGIFGGGERGQALVKEFLYLNCDVVAVCENRTSLKKTACSLFGATCKWYEDFDEFLTQKMDAVLLANFFHEHTHYAIKCLEKGIHVLCECLPNVTMAEGIELIKAVENSKAVFMLLENYPHMLFNREMRKICKSGKLGDIVFAEGEYNHPGSLEREAVEYSIKNLTYYPKHWRNYLPRSYYISHALAPLIYITGGIPKKVSAFNAYIPEVLDRPSVSKVGDLVSIIITQNDNGSVYRVTGHSSFGVEENSYRICGKKGQVENLRGMDGKIMLHYNPWDIPENEKKTNCYTPLEESEDKELIKISGHGGSDFLMVRMFLDCIKGKEKLEPPFDVYTAVTMASVGILAHRAALENKVYDIPDFREEKWRKLYENDRLTPFYSDNSKPNIQVCVGNRDYEPTEEQVKAYYEILGEIDE